MIPRNVFAIWRSFFGFRWKHFSMVGETKFYAFRERIQQEIFRNIFRFLIVTGLWVKPFLFLAEFFQSVVKIAFYLSREQLEVKLIFLKITKTTFFKETGQKALSFFYQIFPGTIVENALFPSTLTISRK